MIILGQLESQLKHLYEERALLLALLAKHYPYTVHVDKELYHSDFRFVVFLELPTGQVSFHVHDESIEQGLFPELKPPLTQPTPWDGHSVQDKMERLRHAINL